jgi:hypothetical protein
VSIIVDSNGLHQCPGLLRIIVGCQYHGWQVDAAAQICNAIAPVLSVAQELTLRFRKHGMTSNDIDLTKWHDLLRPFTCLKVLHVHPRLSRELSRALQLHDRECLQDILPQLCELVFPSRRVDGEAIVAFLNSRRTADRLVRLRLSGRLPIEKWLSRSSTYAAPKTTLVSPISDTSHTSRNSRTTTGTALGRRHASSPSIVVLLRMPVLRDAINHINQTTVRYKIRWSAPLASDNARSSASYPPYHESSHGSPHKHTSNTLTKKRPSCHQPSLAAGFMNRTNVTYYVAYNRSGTVSLMAFDDNQFDKFPPYYVIPCDNIQKSKRPSNHTLLLSIFIIPMPFKHQVIHNKIGQCQPDQWVSQSFNGLFKSSSSDISTFFILDLIGQSSPSVFKHPIKALRATILQ